MPAATTEVRDAPHGPDSHALWDIPRKTELVEANGWLGHLAHILRPNHLVAPLTQTDKAAEEPGPSLHQCEPVCWIISSSLFQMAYNGCH